VRGGTDRCQKFQADAGVMRKLPVEATPRAPKAAQRL
jgi:hypothetical protein